MPIRTIRTGRSCLLIVALLQLVVSLAMPTMFWYALGFGQLHILGRYEELVESGVIDQVKLREVHGGRFADYWELPDDLGMRFQSVYYLAWTESLLFLATSSALLAIWWHGREGATKNNKRHHERAGGYKGD
jgi:hypothetical protein